LYYFTVYTKPVWLFTCISFMICFSIYLFLHANPPYLFSHYLRVHKNFIFCFLDRAIVRCMFWIFVPWSVS